MIRRLVLMLAMLLPLLPLSASADSTDAILRHLAQIGPGTPAAQAYWRGLSAQQQAAAHAQVDLVRVVTDLGPVSASTPAGPTAAVQAAASYYRCYDRTVRTSGVNSFGSVLWSYFQTLHWCSYGLYTTVQDYYRVRWAEVYGYLWTFSGHIDAWFAYGYGYNSVLYGTQGKFQECLAYCVQTKTPWLQQTGYNDGTYYGYWGG